MDEQQTLVLITPDTPGPEVSEVLDIIQASGIACEVTTSSEYTEKVAEHYQTHDLLTGLPNRAAFLTTLEAFIAQAKAKKRRLALIKVDIDDFERINELYSFQLGDDYLQYIGSALQSLYPAIDFIARMDGNGFSIIVNDISEGESALAPIIQHINAVFNAPHALEGHEISTSISMGISIYPDAAKTAEILIKTAYRSLRHAKSLGGNTVIFNNVKRNIQLDKNAVLAHDLKTALENGQLYLMYQPQTYISNKKLSGYEVLLRWNHPTLGAISPAEFIPIAEETGLIESIGRWVFEQAIMQHAEWLNEYYEIMGDTAVSINFSPIQLHDKNILEWVSGTLSQYNVQPKQVVVELTETAIMTDFEHNTAVIQRLRELGLGIAVDDFGTGYSSLTFLGKLPITQLKIDQSFIRSVSVNSKNAAIVKALILLSDALGIEVVAEGVETEQELKYLRDNTCGVIQGYFYSKPLLPKDMALYIQNHT